ncbi:class I SAM-dependent methyltransferase [Planctomycetes bacterium TBK1r]|uniref:Ubiquinone biosynthesis O-methyltransferase n=1 Tax=Stieleria magnilauensis TaxID=2527963 RepID=A0ABX5XHD4_9BACT|nr:Ubiquinone biosynthesis O-methyltransferase [Planctomycetes bacterium TBK1r]
MGIAFSDERASRYMWAHKLSPDARSAERTAIVNLLRAMDLPPTASVVDLGSGHGFVTDALVDALPHTTKITAVEASEDMLDGAAVHSGVEYRNTPLHMTGLPSESIDLVVSLAAFHHVPNKTITLAEIHRILRRGGQVVIADVEHGTRTQRFFDEIVAKYSSTGHDFDFVDPDMMANFARRAGLTHVASYASQTDWQFETTDSLVAFVTNLLSLEMDADTLLDALKSILGITRSRWGQYVLGWDLTFHVLVKLQPPVLPPTSVGRS